MDKNKSFNLLAQVALPTLTIGAQVAFALKYPQWGLAINLAAQPFWFYSGWKAYKNADQIGILITSIIFTCVTIAGLVNYLFL